MAIRIVNHIPMVEEQLRNTGFAQTPWGRRGRLLSTHREFPPIVTVGAVDGSMIPVHHTEVDGFFEELGENLARLEGQYIAVVFEGGGPVRLPAWFIDSCEMSGITIHIVDEANVEGLAERLAKGITRKPTIEDLIAELERSLGSLPFPMYRGDAESAKRKPDETEAEHWLGRLREWQFVKRSNPNLWNKMVRGD
jgi:hypothetical protein